MKTLKLLSFVFIFSCASFSAFSQSDKSGELKPCYQNNEERLQLIKKAEDNQYNIRHIYISGNNHTRHRLFTEKMAKDFNEGDIFTQESLMKSIKGISKLKIIKPITLENVEVRLERDEFRGFDVIDLTFCVEEKKNKL